MDKDLLTPALSPTRKAFFYSILEDQWPKLGLDGAAQVLTTNVEVAETLTQWIHDTKRDMPRSIILTEATAEKQVDPKLQKAANIIPVAKIQDETASHAFAHIPLYRKADTLPILKDVFYALVPKGIAVVTCTKRNPVEEIVLQTLQATGKIRSTGMREFAEADDLRNLAEAAQFELGKIRVTLKEMLVQGEALAALRAQVEKILDGILGQTGDGQSWESTFDGAWNKEVQQKGGLLIEAWVLIAMKWDLLCA